MTEERLKKLFKVNPEQGYDDIVYSKDIILKKLYEDKDLLEVLNNANLNIEQPEDFYNVNIFSYLKVPDTQSQVKNFVCFEINDTEDLYTNDLMINKIVTFMTICHKEDVETSYGVNRQDLLAFFIKDVFQWSNYFGTRLKKIYDTGGVSENGYYYRTIRFKTINTNGLHRGVPDNFTNRFNN